MKLLLFLILVGAISLPCRLGALDDIEIYLAGYGMASEPYNKGITFKGKEVSGENSEWRPLD